MRATNAARHRSVEHDNEANAVVAEPTGQSAHHGEHVWPVRARAQDRTDG